MRRRRGVVAVPLVSAMVGAVASGAVAWAAVHPAVGAAGVPGTTVVKHGQQHQIVVRGDDGERRRVVISNSSSASSQTNPPASHTTSGASGAVR